MELQESDFDLVGLIEHVSKMFEMRCKQKGLGWQVEWITEGTHEAQNDMPPSRLVVFGDEGKLRQVVINLLSNAIKFTQTGEVGLHLAISQTHSFMLRITFDVVDTGIGIAQEHQSRIFNAFDQAASVERREGTGLGLTISQRHVELMGGRLEVTSTPGVGSRFFFTLSFPTTSSLAPDASDDTGLFVSLAEGYSAKALVVDDVKDNRAVLSELLQAVGIEVQAVEDGGQVLDCLATYHPDIVFIDIRMRMLDGVSTVRDIIAAYGSDRPKLVAVSAAALQHERDEYLAVGFDAFIPKPILVQQLYPCIAHLLGVEFVSKPVADHNVATYDVRLPDNLYDGIQQAAKSYRVSQLDRYFDHVAQLGPSGQWMAERLRECKHHGDMDGILQLLAQLSQST